MTEEDIRIARKQRAQMLKCHQRAVDMLQRAKDDTTRKVAPTGMKLAAEAILDIDLEMGSAGPECLPGHARLS
jgi:hypothetical protein